MKTFCFTLVMSTLLAALMLATGAHAAIAPKYLLEARTEAQSHVQVEVISVFPDKARHVCRLQTRIHQAWPQNGHPAAKRGDAFDFEVPCAFPGDELPAGGTIWFQASDLHPFMILEGYFSDGRAVRDQVFQVPYPRAEPWCDTVHETCDREIKLGWGSSRPGALTGE